MFNPNESLSEKFVRRGFWIILFTFLIGPLGYIIRITLTGDLTKEEVGIIYGGMSLLTLLSGYTDLGMTESLNYFLPKFLVKDNYVKAKTVLFITLVVQFLTSIIIALCLFFGSSWLANNYFHSSAATEVLKIFALYFIGIHILQFNITIFSATQNTKFSKGSDFFRTSMTVIAILILFFSSKGSILSYTWAWIIGIYSGVVFTSLLVYFYYYLPYFSKVNISLDYVLIRKFFVYSIGILISANITGALALFDTQFIIYFLGSSEAAEYTIYLAIISIPYILIGPIISFLFPVISEIHGDDSVLKIKSIHSIFSTYISIFILWVSAGFIIIGIPLTVLLFGENYSASGIATIFIAPFLIINIFVQINFQIIAGLGLISDRIKILLYTLLLNSILICIFIFGYKDNWLPFPNGSSAAALAVGISWLLMWRMSYRVIKDYAGSFQYKLFIYNLIAILLVIISYYWLGISQHIPNFGFTGRFSQLSIILFAFFFCIAIFFMINLSKMKEFIGIIRTVRKRS